MLLRSEEGLNFVSVYSRGSNRRNILILLLLSRKFRVKRGRFKYLSVLINRPLIFTKAARTPYLRAEMMIIPE